MTQTDKTLNQEEMPFLASLLKEKQQRQTSFHMPGHKGTLAPHPMLLEYWGGDVQPADLVEIIGIIDYLHAPKDKLLEAQKLAGDRYSIPSRRRQGRANLKVPPTVPESPETRSRGRPPKRRSSSFGARSVGRDDVVWSPVPTI